MSLSVWVPCGCLVHRQSDMTPDTSYDVRQRQFPYLVCSAWVLGTLYRSTNVTLFLYFSVLFLFVQPISLCWLKNSIKGSEIEANNRSILFCRFNCKAIESVIQSPVALPAPSFLERFHTCSVRNCESAFSNPNFKKVAENICQAATYVLSSLRGRKQIFWKKNENFKTSWVVIKTLCILLTTFPLSCLSVFLALDRFSCPWSIWSPWDVGSNWPWKGDMGSTEWPKDGIMMQK